MSPVLDADDAARLQDCVAGGGVAVFPTDTVYGICCDPDSEAAARRLYELKGRSPARACAVMFFALEPALETLGELAGSERQGAVRAAARPGDRAAGEQGAALRGGLQDGPRDARPARAAAARLARRPLRREPSRDAVEREPLGRAGRAVAGRGSLQHARRRRPGARRRRASRHGIHCRRPARLRPAATLARAEGGSARERCGAGSCSRPAAENGDPPLVLASWQLPRLALRGGIDHREAVSGDAARLGTKSPMPRRARCPPRLVVS